MKAIAFRVVFRVLFGVVGWFAVAGLFAIVGHESGGGGEFFGGLACAKFADVVWDVAVILEGGQS